MFTALLKYLTTVNRERKAYGLKAKFLGNGSVDTPFETLLIQKTRL